MENLTKKQIEAIRKTSGSTIIKSVLDCIIIEAIEELNSMVEASNKFGYMRVIGFQ